MTTRNPGTNAGRWQFGPKVWAPVLAVLAVVAIALGTMVALGVNSKTKVKQDFATCVIGEPGCEARPEVHEHADFAMYIRGKQFDFGQDQFVSHEDNEKSPLVHVHDPRHTVVHIHRARTTWDEFFRSLGFELTDKSFLGTSDEKVCLAMPDGSKLCNTANEKWKFFINGVKVDGLANQEIHDLDRVLFSYGSESEDQVRQEQVPKVTDQACIVSEICTDRIDPNEPVENCSKNSTTCH